MEKISKLINKNKIYIIIFLLVIPSVVPLLRSGFFHFSDEPHIADLYQMIRAISSGQVPPRWAPDMSYGYGYPLFNFYYPLPFYLGSIFYYLSGSLITSLKLLFLVTMPLSAFFMYKWLRLHTNKFNSFIGVIIYTYTPYRAVDLYVRGALGELFSFIFFPITSYLTFLIMKKGKRRDIGLLALSVGLFVLSHNLAPLFFVPWLGAYAFALVITGYDFKNLLKVVAGVSAGILSSAYFWFPALIESVNLAGHTPFNYKDHFPFIKQLIFPSWGYGASHPGIYDDISFQIGVVNIVLIIATLIVILKGRKKIIQIVTPFYFILSLFIVVFLMNIRSTFLWEISSLSAYIQFPWRLLLLTTFLTSSLVIFIGKKGQLVKMFLLTLAFISFVNSVLYFKPSEYFTPDDNYYLKRFFADRTIEGKSDQISMEYANYSEDYLLLPTWVEERPEALLKEKINSYDVVLSNISEVNATFYTANVDKGVGVVRANIYYYPGWKVEVDGEPRAINVEKPYGNISFNILEGDKTFKIFWSETLLRRTANYISISVLILVVYLIFKNNNQKKIVKKK